ncbi:MAG: alpha/beta fold hydrolase, partial [Sphingomicrobium sp.]
MPKMPTPDTIDEQRRLLMVGAGAMIAAGAFGASGATAAKPKAALRSGYAPVDGLRVYYELHGPPLSSGKPPVVLLHGGMMAIDTAFSKDLLPRLARKRSVIAIEQQGHGHTADRNGPTELDRMVDDTAGVLAHLKVRDAHFVGHSMGGMITLGMAVRHPRLVRTATAIST